MKLISATKFILDHEDIVEHKFQDLCLRYAKFLQRKLEMWMFIPCGADGIPLILSERGEVDEFERCKEQDAYREAEKRVLFKGFKLGYQGMEGRFGWVQNDTGDIKIYSLEYQTETIEDMISRIELELTETAVKELGL
jgi:hypothetical protein